MGGLLAFAARIGPAAQAQNSSIQTTSTPLILPAGVAYDAQGNLYIAETGRNLVRRVAPDGTMTTVAGTGTQGFSGDGGPATAADFDSPEAVAVDGADNLLIADTHNQRVRRVDAASGIVSTVAGPAQTPSAPGLVLPSALAIDGSGNVFIADAGTHRILRRDAVSGGLSIVAGDGTQGSGGDGGPALAASLDSPYGLALDAAGDLFLSDTHNQRVRRIDHLSNVITSIAGTGQPGFSGDGAAATAAALRLPRGLAVDASGNLLLADAANHRIRRIDAASGQITTIAGDGVQTFSGDGGAGALSSLDSPAAVAAAPSGLAAVADTHNGRVRQLDSTENITTIAGPGSPVVGGLNLVAPSAFTYGSGSVTVAFVGSAATGTVAFYDLIASQGGPQLLATEPLAGNMATLPAASLAAGVHHLSAIYSGDAAHTAAQSKVVAITISPAPATVDPTPVSAAFGAALPPLAGSLSGILPQDAQAVSLVLSSPATLGSAPGSYPIMSALAGPAAGNYTLTSTPAALTILRAPALASLSSALAVHVASETSGTPSGQISLLDGTTVTQTAMLDGSGNASFAAASLSSGSHTLSALYAGNADFLAAQSAPLLLSTGPGSSPDFNLASTGANSQTIVSGSSAAFAFSAAPVNGTLNSAIQLAAAGLPPGATASFNPAYLPPGAGSTAFTLSVKTVATSSVAVIGHDGPGEANLPAFGFALGLPVLLLLRRRRPSLRIGCAALSATALIMLVGCGSRTSAAGTAAGAPVRLYTITVTGTATSDSGATLDHTVYVTLNVS